LRVTNYATGKSDTVESKDDADTEDNDADEKKKDVDSGDESEEEDKIAAENADWDWDTEEEVDNDPDELSVRSILQNPRVVFYQDKYNQEQADREWAEYHEIGTEEEAAKVVQYQEYKKKQKESSISILKSYFKGGGGKAAAFLEMEAELEKVKGLEEQNDNTKSKIIQLEKEMQATMKSSGLSSADIKEAKKKVAASGKPVKRSIKRAVISGATKAGKKAASGGDGIYKIVTFAKGMADPQCGSPFDAMGMAEGGGFSVSLYFDIGPAVYNSVSLVQEFTAGGGIDFELPLPCCGGLLSLIGGGSLYITFGSKVTVVPVYELQRIWALYKLKIYAGLTLDLADKIYTKMGEANARKLKKYVNLVASITLKLEFEWTWKDEPVNADTELVDPVAGVWQKTMQEMKITISLIIAIGFELAASSGLLEAFAEATGALTFLFSNAAAYARGEKNAPMKLQKITATIFIQVTATVLYVFNFDVVILGTSPLHPHTFGLCMSSLKLSNKRRKKRHRAHASGVTD